AARRKEDAEARRRRWETAEDDRADHRREDDEHAGDESGVRGRRVLQPHRLERVAGEKSEAGDRAELHLALGETPEGPDDREHPCGKQETEPDEEEGRHARDRVLDDGERGAPDDGNADESKLPAIASEAVARAHSGGGYTPISRWRRTPSRR